MTAYINVCMRNRNPIRKSGSASTYVGYTAGTSTISATPATSAVELFIYPVSYAKTLAHKLKFRTPVKTVLSAYIMGGIGGRGGGFVWTQTSGPIVIGTTVYPPGEGGVPVEATTYTSIGSMSGLYIRAGGCGYGGKWGQASGPQSTPTTTAEGGAGGAGYFSVVVADSLQNFAGPKWSHPGMIIRSFGGGGGGLGFWGGGQSSEIFGQGQPQSGAARNNGGQYQYSLVLFL